MVKKIILLACCFISLSAISLWAEIPLPDDAKLVKASEPDSSPIHVGIKMYRTSLSPNQLTAFFNKVMPKAGWTEEKGARGSLKFRNGQDTVMILPLSKLSRDGKIAFTVTEAKMPSKEELTATQKDRPDALVFMPVYPNAKQRFLWDLPRGAGLSAAYVTPDNIEDVVLFYKSKMINYGWFIAQETPVIRSPVSLDSGLAKKKLTEMKKSDTKFTGEEAKASFIFQKPTGERCAIHLFSSRVDTNEPVISTVNPVASVSEQQKSQPKSISTRNTEILVTYNEAKK